MNLKTFIRDIPDFPTAGVIFRDITPLLKDPKAIKFTEEALLDLVGNLKVDKVVGMESRGFFFAPMLAARLNAGFVPVRKPGKLPFATMRQDYDLEYGSDALEMHSDAIIAGDKVLVHDDVLATGGTAQATCRLIEKMGGEIVQCNFLLELDFLKGKDKLVDFAVKSLLHY
ncbi:adenine phosphoribosyltransferase [Maribacter polysiphoniae]|uniref:Adenine phosphoribosyltransferase n=1 Tax=Maribacter polysiphoniae TaxID=429344 RepID=A0A316EPA3_9FLAO|nr:adenine phosphoribosyltransferase [Maribacter polysiphoniae]MBD1259270.1 adenine phosphoribosyltransferase [Maribacter polysiphoniae]PWK24830.1 adenine phosphoribosyltransferase [Maribacter polysiphoniae]